jgi:arylformamidase
MLITMEHLGPVAEAVKPGEGLIFQTGWSQFASDPSIYRDQLPRISEPLARWMAAKKVNLLGVEPPSVADVNNLEELQSVHRILMEGDVLILEGLCNLENIRKEYVQMVALPLKIGGGDGAPVRAIIIES